VDAKFILEWVPQQARSRVDAKTAWRIIKTHYCAALVGRGVCPIQCENCREAILSMFRLQKARVPEALLTWLAKDRSAAMIEKLIAAQKNERLEEFPSQETSSDPFASLFPRKKGDNLFLEMEKDYE
jgi:hypothetical protein